MARFFVNQHRSCAIVSSRWHFVVQFSSSLKRQVYMNFSFRSFVYHFFGHVASDKFEKEKIIQESSSNPNSSDQFLERKAHNVKINSTEPWSSTVAQIFIRNIYEREQNWVCKLNITFNLNAMMKSIVEESAVNLIWHLWEPINFYQTHAIHFNLGINDRKYILAVWKQP